MQVNKTLTGCKRKEIDEETELKQNKLSSELPAKKKQKLDRIITETVNNNDDKTKFKKECIADFVSSDGESTETDSDDGSDDGSESEDIDLLSESDVINKKSWSRTMQVMLKCQEMECEGFGSLPVGYKFEECKGIKLMIGFNVIGRIYGKPNDIYKFLVDYIKCNHVRWSVAICTVIKGTGFVWSNNLIDKDTSPMQQLDNVIKAFNKHYGFPDLISIVEYSCNKLSLDEHNIQQ